jgi:predicted nucleotidyltransferase
MSQKLHLGDVEVDHASLAGLCRRHRVRELSLFGSAARGEMRPDSDIDLLVEFLPNTDVGLIGHARLMLDLEQLLGRKIDLVSRRELKPRIRSSVLADARLVYAA